MRGTIIQTAKYTEVGLISGSDNVRYTFERSALRNGDVAAGDDVNFEVKDGVAHGIYRIERANPAPSTGNRDWFALLFSFKGRVSRKDFWIFGVLIPLSLQMLLNHFGLIGIVFMITASWSASR